MSLDMGCEMWDAGCVSKSGQTVGREWSRARDLPADSGNNEKMLHLHENRVVGEGEGWRGNNCQGIVKKKATVPIAP